MKHIQLTDTVELDRFFQPRPGETKLGETVLNGNQYSMLVDKNQDLPRYVIIGIPEDIGPRANRGRGGAQHMWEWFLKALLNVQDNEFLHGKNISVLGQVCTGDLMAALPETIHTEDDFLLAEKNLKELDNRVAGIMTTIFANHGIPVVIGGGHNNALGILQAYHALHGTVMYAVNLDAHGDLRDTGTAHSGNPFSRALDAGYLAGYINIGLQESYNNQYILNRFNNDKRTVYYSHDALLRGDLQEEKIMDDVRERIQLKPAGIDFDLDSIIDFPSSAQAVSGFTMNDARRWIINLAAGLNVKYLHLPEGAPEYGDRSLAGKKVAFLVTDFIKTLMRKK